MHFSLVYNGIGMRRYKREKQMYDQLKRRYIGQRKYSLFFENFDKKNFIKKNVQIFYSKILLKILHFN